MFYSLHPSIYLSSNISILCSISLFFVIYLSILRPVQWYTKVFCFSVCCPCSILLGWMKTFSNILVTWSTSRQLPMLLPLSWILWTTLEWEMKISPDTLRVLLVGFAYMTCCLVGWGCIIHRLLLCRGVRPSVIECPGMALNNTMVRFQ